MPRLATRWALAADSGVGGTNGAWLPASARGGTRGGAAAAGAFHRHSRCCWCQGCHSRCSCPPPQLPHCSSRAAPRDKGCALPGCGGGRLPLPDTRPAVCSVLVGAGRVADRPHDSCLHHRERTLYQMWGHCNHMKGTLPPPPPITAAPSSLLHPPLSTHRACSNQPWLVRLSRRPAQPLHPPARQHPPGAGCRGPPWHRSR